MEEWKRSLSNKRIEEHFAKYTYFNNLTKSDIDKMTSKVSLEQDIDFPLWIRTLEAIMANINIPEDKYKRKHPEKPFYHLLYPFVDFFKLSFNEYVKSYNITVPSNQVLGQLESSLYEDLVCISWGVLIKELSEFKKGKTKNLSNRENDFFYKKFVFKILSNKYKNLFLDYPMLARKLAVKTHVFIGLSCNLFKRFQNDKHELQAFFNKEFNKIRKLNLSSGDIHNGEATIIFEFDNSVKLVYKPSDSAVTLAFNSLLNWVNSCLGCKLKSFKVLLKDNYSWLEYVENKECENIKEIKSYYENAGILTGIAYFLNARDFHYENLIASGNSPVLIDHETVVNPIVKRENKRIKIDTVLETLLLPDKKKNKPSYIFGFGSSVQLEKKGFTFKIKKGNTDDMSKVMENRTFKLYKSNKPKLDKKIKNLKDYDNEFAYGFKKLYFLIIKEKSFLLSDNSPLKSFENLKIRFINRPTGVYFKLLSLLNKPEYLKDATRYGIKIELLARAYLDRDDWPVIVNSERRQILSDNIPIFYTNTSSKKLHLFKTRDIDDFDLSAMDVIYHKIKNAGKKDYVSQLNLIREAIPL
ncbi:MAG: type 2 lanthipeptide synthetase LanM [Bacteroidota bacterium]